MALTLYHYPNCTSCRKARKWLADQEIDARLVNLVEEPPSKGQLKSILKKSGQPLRKLFNTSGVSYREGRFKERLPTMSEAQALDALASDGKLIKRPILVGPDFARIGFNEGDWREVLSFGNFPASH